MEYLEEDRKVLSLDKNLADVIEDLPEIFDECDELILLEPLNDDELDEVAELSIPDGKILYVNPTNCSDLDERYEFLLSNPRIKVCDERGEEFDLMEFVQGIRLGNIHKDLGTTLTSSGEMEDVA